MSKARIIYKDEAGNTLWERQLKGRKQVYAKNRYGRLVTEKDTAEMMNRAGYMKMKNIEDIKPISPKGRRLMKYFY